jgi:hypothetical protein
MAGPADGSGITGSARSRRWWRDAATSVAVIGVLVTLIFNTIAVWREEKQAGQTRVAAEVSLLTQLGLALSQADQAVITVAGGRLIERRCDPFPVEGGTATATLWRALAYYDFLAWLFNQEHVTTQGAYEYWAPSLVDAYHLVTGFRPRKEIDENFSDLASFRRATPRELWPESSCRKEE